MKKSKAAIYSEEFKWKVVRDVLSGRYSKDEARKIYGIKSNCAILYWMRKYSGIDDPRQGGKPLETSSKMESSKKEKELEEKIKKLEQELIREQLRADLWQKMVEVAEQKMGIDIRKKYGAKPSSPSDKKEK